MKRNLSTLITLGLTLCAGSLQAADANTAPTTNTEPSATSTHDGPRTPRMMHGADTTRGTHMEHREEAWRARKADEAHRREEWRKRRTNREHQREERERHKEAWEHREIEKMKREEHHIQREQAQIQKQEQRLQRQEERVQHMEQHRGQRSNMDSRSSTGTNTGSGRTSAAHGGHVTQP